MDPNPIKDFFISYNKADRAWAEWIGWQLEQEGFTCILQAWDFRPGGNFVLGMHRAATQAQRTIAVFSPDYLTALYTQPEWAAAFVQDPTGKDGKLLPVRVRECQPDGILAAIIYIDLYKLDEPAARAELLAGVKRTRAKPTGPLPFPGATSPTPKPSISFPGNWPEVWEAPYRRNTFFTGRDELLERLYNELTTHNKTMALTQTQAISGLGGIGKTQTALEYAYLHRHEYRYVLWTTADTAEGLSTAYVKFAELLQVPGRDEKDQQRTIQAFKRWLAHQRDWLLILDNADDVMRVRDFLPDGPYINGHIILTTRAQALGGIANAIDIEKMGKQEGVQFLLKRVKSNGTTSAERTAAEKIVRELDGLPLALDQAGAYVEETGCSLAAYLKFYETRRKELLKRRGRLAKDHPETVATTWSISLQKVEKENPAAVDLLKLCAFLAPDAIQEEMIMEGARYLGKDLGIVAADAFLFNEAIGLLRRYSLVKRNQETNSLSMHRLVQVVLKDGMDMEEQKQWAERAVQVVSEVFPFGEYENWEQCRRYLSHAQVCIELIKQYEIESPEASYLLYDTGCFFYQQGDYRGAEECYKYDLHISQKIFGFEHRDTAATLHGLGSLYQAQRNYEEAERFYKQALAIEEKTQGLEHPSTAARTLHQLGRLYHDQRKYEEAEAFYKQALAITEKTIGIEHPDTINTIKWYASLLYETNRTPEAKKLLARINLTLDDLFS
jgi:tetratricopeptide (TPR) repeat protein